MKKFKKLLSYFLVGSLIVSSMTILPKTSDAAAVSLATFSFNKTDGPSTANDLNDTYGTKADDGYSPKSGIMSSSKLYASVDITKSEYRKLEWSKDDSYTYNNTPISMPIMASGIKNPWGSAACFLIKTSTKGYEDITLSFILGGSKKGPKDYKLQYSVDGKSFATISDTSMSLHTNKKMYSYSYELPSLADKQTLYIRIITASTDTIEGGSFTSVNTSGETAINNIVLKGSELSSTAATPKPTTKPSSTTGTDSNASSGTSVDSNQTADTSKNPDNTSNQSEVKKKLSAPSLTSYKAGKKVIRGKAVKKAKITIKVGKKTYTATVTKKGTFKVTLKQKLKKGQIIKLSATKKNYTKSKTKKYTVK